MKTNRLNKKISIKNLLVIILVTAIITSTFSYIVFSSPDALSFTTVIAPGSMTETATYVIFKDGNTYYAKSGLTGEILFSDIDFSTLMQNVLDDFTPNEGAKIFIREGYYVADSTIHIRNNTRHLTIEGISGYGKSYSEGGGFSGTHIKSNVDGQYPIIFDNYPTTDDVRNIFGIEFKNIKFEGTRSTSPVDEAIHLHNADTVHISNCFFIGFGRAITLDFVGSTYPNSERPGEYWIYNNLFTEGEHEYIKIERSTQFYIYDNTFESWGGFIRHIYLVASEKGRIHDNEFNHNNDPSTMTEYILLNSYADPYMVHGLLIHNNYAWFHENSNKTVIKWIREEGQDTAYDIVSRDNLLHFAWDIRTTPTGGYCPYSDPLLGNFDDLMRYFGLEPEDRYHDVTPGSVNPYTYSVDTVYQHKWSPVRFFIIVEGAGTGTSTECRFEISKDNVNWMASHTIRGTDRNSFTVFVPTGYYFRLIDGSATVIAWSAMYR